MITLDTSAVIALFDERESAHAAVAQALNTYRPPYIVPAGILSEITYIMETRLDTRTEDLFLADLQAGAYQLDCGEQDLGFIRQLVTRYSNLPLGFADASVVACAERHGGTVATLDRRHFAVVAGEHPIKIVP